jgi:hypothetical protein
MVIVPDKEIAKLKEPVMARRQGGGFSQNSSQQTG